MLTFLVILSFVFRQELDLLTGFCWRIQDLGHI